MTVRGGGVPASKPWLLCRGKEWVRRLGASPPMRMTASCRGGRWPCGRKIPFDMLLSRQRFANRLQHLALGSRPSRPGRNTLSVPSNFSSSRYSSEAYVTRSSLDVRIFERLPRAVCSLSSMSAGIPVHATSSDHDLCENGCRPLVQSTIKEENLLWRDSIVLASHAAAVLRGGTAASGRIAAPTVARTAPGGSLTQ
jgi:hypothetical protein